MRQRAGAMASAADNLRAAGLMTAGIVAFCLNDAVVKHLSGHLPVGEIMGLRGVCMVALLPALLRPMALRLTLPDRWAVARGLCEVGVAFCFLLALHVLPLGDTYTLYFAAPVMLTAVVALTGREAVGAQRWLAVAAGFLGVLVVIGPPRAWTLAAALPLGAAALSVVRDLATRRCAPGLGAGTVAMTTAVLVGAAGLATVPAGWLVPSGAQVAWAALAAVGAGLGYVLFVAGLRLGDVSFVAPFRYAAIPVAMGLDIAIWDAVPQVRMAAGAAVIIASGLTILWCERRRGRGRQPAADEAAALLQPIGEERS